MKRSNKDKPSKEKKIARQIYKQEKELTEQEIRRQEKAKQKIRNRIEAQREAEANTRPIPRVKKEGEVLNKVADGRKSINTASRVSAEARAWLGLGSKINLG